MASIANCDVTLHHDDDGCLWLVAIGGSGDPAALTVQVDTGTGYIRERFVENPPGFPSLAFGAETPRGAWCLGDGARSLRITTAQGEVLDIESGYFRA